MNQCAKVLVRTWPDTITSCNLVASRRVRKGHSRTGDMPPYFECNWKQILTRMWLSKAFCNFVKTLVAWSIFSNTHQEICEWPCRIKNHLLYWGHLWRKRKSVQGHLYSACGDAFWGLEPCFNITIISLRSNLSEHDQNRLSTTVNK